MLTVNIPDHQNRRIYMSGSTVGSLVPYIDKQQTMVEEACVEAIPCCRASINNAVMAIDSHGAMAMWGSLYETIDD